MIYLENVFTIYCQMHYHLHHLISAVIGQPVLILSRDWLWNFVLLTRTHIVVSHGDDIFGCVFICQYKKNIIESVITHRKFAFTKDNGFVVMKDVCEANIKAVISKHRTFTPTPSTVLLFRIWHFSKWSEDICPSKNFRSESINTHTILTLFLVITEDADGYT